jgi:hypothetical protein
MIVDELGIFLQYKHLISSNVVLAKQLAKYLIQLKKNSQFEPTQAIVFRRTAVTRSKA